MVVRCEVRTENGVRCEVRTVDGCEVGGRQWAPTGQWPPFS